MINRIKSKVIAPRNQIEFSTGGTSVTVGGGSQINSSVWFLNDKYLNQGNKYNSLTELMSVMSANDTIVLEGFTQSGNITIGTACNLFFIDSVLTAGNLTLNANVKIYGNGIIDNIINNAVLQCVGDFQVNTVINNDESYFDIRKLGDFEGDADFHIKCYEFGTLDVDNCVGFLEFDFNNITNAKIIDIDTATLTLKCTLRTNYNTVNPANYPIITKDSNLNIHDSTLKNSFVPVGAKGGLIGMNNTNIKMTNVVYDVQDVYVADPITLISNLYYNGSTSMNKQFTNVANEFVLSNKNIDSQITL